MANFLGMRGTLDWATNEDPQNWRQGIFRLKPNGKAQILGILSMMGGFGSQSYKPGTAAKSAGGIPSTVHNWWTQKYVAASGSVTAVYTESTLTTLYTSGGVAGDTVYVKCAETTADKFRIGHQVMIMLTTDNTMYVTGKATDVVRNGVSSYERVLLLEADNNSTASPANDLSNADRILVIGNINPQGGRLPANLKKNPTPLSNVPQIFRTPISLTNSALTQELRTEDPYTKEKRDGMDDHSAEMEWATVFGVRSERTGDNGKPEYTMDGVISLVRANTSNVYDYRTDTDFSGKTWVQGGMDWIEKVLEIQARYNSDGYLLECGGKALTGLGDLARTYGHINLEPGDLGFGIKTVDWMSNHYSEPLHFRQHPLFAIEDYAQNMVLGIPPGELSYLPVKGRDTDLLKNRQANDEDAKIDEYFTECTIRIDNPDKFMVMFGFGQANTV